MAIKMLNKLRRNTEELSENVSKEIANVKKNQSELEDTITEMRNTLERTSSRLEDAKEQVSTWKAGWWKSPNPSSKKKKGF